MKLNFYFFTFIFLQISALLFWMITDNHIDLISFNSHINIWNMLKIFISSLLNNNHISFHHHKHSINSLIIMIESNRIFINRNIKIKKRKIIIGYDFPFFFIIIPKIPALSFVMLANTGMDIDSLREMWISEIRSLFEK